MNPTFVVWLQLTGLLAAEAAIVVGIAAQLQRVIKSAAWRRTIWHVCIASLLLLVVFEFTGVARGFFGWSGKRTAAAKPIPTRVARTVLPVSVEHIAQSSQIPADFGQTLEVHATRNAQSVTPTPTVTVKQAKHYSTIAADGESLSVLWLWLVWVAGAAFVVGRALVSRIILEILRWKHGRIDDGEIRETARTLALRLGIHRRIRLMESGRIGSPVAFGILRPTIGLPVQFTRKFNAIQREAMLVHELAHLAGNDPAWYLLADALAAVLWWHPLAWWARRQLHAQSELAADEASLLVANGPGVLAECLVELGAQLARQRSFMPLGVAGNGFRSGLGRRVERLVKLDGTLWRPPSRIRCGLAMVIGPVALVTAAILCTAWVVPPALTKGENMQTMKQTWKKSLAAFALLAALSPDGNRAVAEPNTPQPGAAPLYVAGAEPGFHAASLSGGTSSVSAGSSENFADSVARFNRLTMSKEQQSVEEKLERITLSSIKYDSLPLTEVINNLVETCAKQERNGINFVLDRETPASASGPGAIDPATGLPVAAPTGNTDLSSVTVKIDPPLKNIRLIDVLDVITKTADQPIHYTIEDYGVLFSLGAKPKEEPRRAMFQDRLATVVARPVPSALEVMTFKVDTNTFFDNMERTFGEKLLKNTPAQIRATLQDIFQRSFGINLAGQDKTLFYNDATGILMVRGTPQDVATMQGAIEMLGGAPYSKSDAATYQRDREYEAIRRNSGSGGGGGSGGVGVGPIAKPPGNQ